MVKIKKDLTGMKFGRLTVVRQSENDYTSPNGQRFAQWLCKCECGNTELIEVPINRLKSGNTKSCGCINKEFMLKMNHNKRQSNTYDLSGEYGIGYTTKGEEFWFDLEDYDKIKDYCWWKNNAGYFVTKIESKEHLIHRIIMDVDGEDWKEIQIDHRFGKDYRFDNRKRNLRRVTASQNGMNQGIQINNTSGTTGVHWHKLKQKWIARIFINGKEKWLGEFDNKEEAIVIRKNAEEKYFGEYSFDNSIKNHNE